MQVSSMRGPGIYVALTGAVGLLLLMFAEPAAAQEGSTVGVGGNNELGDFLVGPDEMTLYIFENDEQGVSNCTGDCAAAWPPLTVEAGEEPTAGDGVDGELATIERDDGSMQVTLDGMPLYYWASDEAPGDATGQGVNDVWFVVEVSQATESNGENGDGTTDDRDDAEAPAAGTGLADESAGLSATEFTTVAGALLVIAGAGLGYTMRRSNRGK